MDARPWRSANADDIAVDPELSAIALLDVALLVAIQALFAFVPEFDPRARTWDQAPPHGLAAREIVVHARHLRDLLNDYRRHLDNRSAQDEIPF